MFPEIYSIWVYRAKYIGNHIAMCFQCRKIKLYFYRLFCQNIEYFDEKWCYMDFVCRKKSWIFIDFFAKILNIFMKNNGIWTSLWFLNRNFTLLILVFIQKLQYLWPKFMAKTFLLARINHFRAILVYRNEHVSKIPTFQFTMYFPYVLK